mgnify:FL=1
MVLTLVPIYGFTLYQINNYGEFSYNEAETSINELSTGRYLIWKECIITQDGHELFGTGSLNNVHEARDNLIAQNPEAPWEYQRIHLNELNPHNGYIAQISATGWVGFALFIAILAQRIKRAEHLNKGRWYLLIIYTLVINCFESLFILNRFFTCFYMLLILETDMEQPDEPKKLA